MNRDPQSNPAHATNPSDLDWQAFLYVRGELEGEAFEQFEALLDDNQQAREAVADAVAVTHCIASAESRSSGSAASPARNARRKQKSFRLQWSAVGLALTIGLLMLWHWIPVERPDAGNRTVGNVAAPEDLQALAKVWMEDAFQEDSALPLGQVDAESFDSDGTWQEEGSPTWASDFAPATADETLTAPSWMMLAVMEASSEASPDNPPDATRSPPDGSASFPSNDTEET